MCNPVAASFASGAVSAVGGAMQASQANAAKRRDYERKLQIRENKWMRDTSLFKTKKVQFEKNISEANIAAQRAYTQSQINFNNVRVKAMMDHQTDFKNMLEAEGMIEASAAERGIRGKTVERLLTLNLAKMGLANAARSRALTQSQYALKEGNERIRRKLISDQNREWSKVSVQLIPDLEPVQPVMQNVGANLFLGLAGAGIDAGQTYMEQRPKTFGPKE